MIVLIDTSTPVCKLLLVDNDKKYTDEWHADRGLAKGLLAYLRDQLQLRGKTFDDVTGIGVFKGPGSFTGLRIGLAVLNTMAEAQNIPIIGVTGDDWQNHAIELLNAGKNDRIVMPLYGSDANITTPRK